MKKCRPHLLVLCVLAVVVLSGMDNVLRSAVTDLRFGWISRQASGQIALVAIDPPSLDEIGVWPWPRKLHAALIDRLEKAGAADIAFDVDFSSVSNPDSDQAFVDALKRAGGSVVLPAFKQVVGSGGHQNTVYVSRPLPQFSEHAWPAVVNVPIGRDGLVRRYSYGETLDGRFLPSFGALLAGKYNTHEEPFQIDFIRWRHPGRGLVLPDDFMPVANASSNSDDIARWVMKDACTQGSLWQQQGHNVRLAVNLSPSQFQSSDFVPSIESILNSTGFSSSLLELEVTESILLEDDERALEIFRQIQALGVHIAFDDFGTGYASLTYLKKFPLNKLKIDRSFVHKLRENSDDLAIVGATITLGKLLGLSVIAEGIEDKATADLLSNRGCDEGQGYYFGRPMPAEEFERKFLSKDVLAMPERSVAVRAMNAA
jgi:EAL domain-containing protein (putative c-di-GMP-specific phosphodiesterase class I)